MSGLNNLYSNCFKVPYVTCYVHCSLTTGDKQRPVT